MIYLVSLGFYFHLWQDCYLKNRLVCERHYSENESCVTFGIKKKKPTPKYIIDIGTVRYQCHIKTESSLSQSDQ